LLANSAKSGTLVLQAQGKKEAAALLEMSSVAVDLAKLEKIGLALDDKKTFFFGSGASTLPQALLSKL